MATTSLYHQRPHHPASRGGGGGLPPTPRVHVTRPPGEDAARDAHRSGSPAAAAVPSAVPGAIGALLAALRALERSLAQWAALQVPADAVSDAFVTAGDRYNAARAALAARGIDTTDIAQFLPDLRNVLEDRLSEDPTPDNAARAREEGRLLIQRLLLSLRDKSPLYWQLETASSTDGQPRSSSR